MASNQATVEQINTLLGQIDTRVGEAQRRINKTLADAWFVPDWLIEQIKNLWNKFVDLLNKLWENLKEVFQNLGDPFKLSDTANEWSTKVGTPVSARVSLATEGELGVDNNWTGTAADRYKENLLNQRTALDKVKSNFSTGIADVLSGMALAIWVFWGAVVLGFLAFLGQLIASFGADATILGIPAGILLKITAVVTLGAAITFGIVQLRIEASNATTTLNNKMDFNGYPNGFWPSATTS
jgi:hypothetical protein